MNNTTNKILVLNGKNEGNKEMILEFMSQLVDHKNVMETNDLTSHFTMESILQSNLCIYKKESNTLNADECQIIKTLQSKEPIKLERKFSNAIEQTNNCSLVIS